MKVNSINSLVFNGKIIDSHTHYGKWNEQKTFDMESLDKFIKTPLEVVIDGKKDSDTVEKILVSSLNSMAGINSVDEVKGLEETINFAKGNSKIGVLAVCQPNLTEGKPEALKTAIEKNRNEVLGLKFHPFIMSETKNSDIIDASHDFYKPYMQMAKELKLPCLFHTDGNALSKPELVYGLAKEYKDVPVILGHCGGHEEFMSALEALKKSVETQDSSLYCDISWLNWENGLPDGKHESVKTLISELKEKNGLNRILFGTDAPLGCFGEKLEGGLSEKQAYEKTVSSLKTMIKREFKEEADEIIERIFYKNAEELFYNKNSEVVKPKAQSIAKRGKGGSIAWTLGIVGVAIGALAGFRRYNKAEVDNSDIKK